MGIFHNTEEDLFLPLPPLNLCWQNLSVTLPRFWSLSSTSTKTTGYLKRISKISKFGSVEWRIIEYVRQGNISGLVRHYHSSPHFFNPALHHSSNIKLWWAWLAQKMPQVVRASVAVREIRNVFSNSTFESFRTHESARQT